MWTSGLETASGLEKVVSELSSEEGIVPGHMLQAEEGCSAGLGSERGRGVVAVFCADLYTIRVTRIISVVPQTPWKGCVMTPQMME